METTPVAVTVFPDRARVTRQGQAVLEKGIQKIDVGPLPMALQPDSVRATGQGTARVRLLGVSTRLVNFTETPAEAAGALEKKIEAAEDEDRGLVAREAGLERQQAFVDGLASQSEMFARGLALKYRAPEEQGAIFDFVAKRLEQLQAERQEAGRARRELAKELDRLRRELRQVQAERPRQRFVATVELDVSAAGEFDLQLTYVVTGAAWTPLYDVRLLPGGLDLTYMAQVTQQTGENWPNVALTLSTAQPRLALIIPELAPWYIAPEPAYPMVAARGGGAPKAGVFTAMAAMPQASGAGAEPSEPPAPAPKVEAMEVEEATVSATGAALTYQLAARADIPGTGDRRKVTVAVVNFKPTLDYVTAPRREAVCYRRATVKNDSVYSLLPGPAQLFEGDEYSGATRLEFVAPGQEFELALGADERLRVERELVARDVDKTFMGDRRRLRYAYTIEIENLRDGPQIVWARDQVPVPRNEQIKVKLEAADPKPDQQTDLNQLEWKLVLDKAAKQKIRFEFSVEYPRTMEVNGLP
jgi:uncharacterized protein (TIGR02231 family)